MKTFIFFKWYVLLWMWDHPWSFLIEAAIVLGFYFYFRWKND